MTCPYCGEKTWIMDTRCPDGEEVYRKRMCRKCGKEFRTIEMDSDAADKGRYTGWRKVEDELPKQIGNYLLCDGKGRMRIGLFVGNEKAPFGFESMNPNYDPTEYWMPLPREPRCV